MFRLAETVAIGLVSGVLSGMFGIGGGAVTTPAIRLLLGAPALIAVGTPLMAIIPSTVTGAISYARRGLADPRAGLVLGIAGSATAVAGAWATRLAGGTAVLVATGVVILYMAGDMLLQVARPPGGAAIASGDTAAAPGATAASDPPTSRPSLAALLVIGAATGLYSGFLGLGGGFVLVPMLTRWLRFDVKRAIGTSLVAISVLALPGTITHWLLGNIDWRIGVALAVGVVPGALLGARITFGASERALRVAFAAFIALVGVWLVVSELTGGLT